MSWNREVKKCYSPSGVFLIPVLKNDSDLSEFVKVDNDLLRFAMDIYRPDDKANEFIKDHNLNLV